MCDTCVNCQRHYSCTLISEEILKTELREILFVKQSQMHIDQGGHPQNRTEGNTFVKQSQMHLDLGGNPQNRTEGNNFVKQSQRHLDIGDILRTELRKILLSNNHKCTLISEEILKTELR